MIVTSSFMVVMSDLSHVFDVIFHGRDIRSVSCI